jgi:alpha-L-arabinofuranosidase
MPAAKSDPAELLVDPQPRFHLSPSLFMQFMEPLGTTDGSVEAAWDFQHDCWREDVITATRELAPPLIRWGGT